MWKNQEVNSLCICNRSFFFRCVDKIVIFLVSHLYLPILLMIGDDMLRYIYIYIYIYIYKFFIIIVEGIITKIYALDNFCILLHSLNIFNLWTTTAVYFNGSLLSSICIFQEYFPCYGGCHLSIAATDTYTIIVNLVRLQEVRLQQTAEPWSYLSNLCETITPCLCNQD